MVLDNRFSQYFFKFNLSKLFSKGRVDEAYERMYTLAHDLATEELKKNLDFLDIQLRKDKNLQGREYWEKYLEKILKFKEERIEHHMKEMKELLKLSLEEKK